MPSGLPGRPPRRNHETAPFWDGCARGVFVLPRCTACGEFIWYPRRFCPFCANHSVDWVETSGRGTIYSLTIMRQGSGPYRELTPYILAYVELAEGPRVLTNVVGADPQSMYVGQTVHVVFDEVGEGDAIPRFAV